MYGTPSKRRVEERVDDDLDAAARRRGSRCGRRARGNWRADRAAQRRFGVAGQHVSAVVEHLELGGASAAPSRRSRSKSGGMITPRSRRRAKALSMALRDGSDARMKSPWRRCRRGAAARAGRRLVVDAEAEPFASVER
jgi:hypothetical protein